MILNNGFDGLIAQAKTTAKLSAVKPLDSNTPLDKWTRRRPDGSLVKLVAIGRPPKDPYYWWDPDGKPIAFNPDWHPDWDLKADSDYRVIFQTVGVGIEGTNNPYYQRTDLNGDNLAQDRIYFGFGYGPSTEIGTVKNVGDKFTWNAMEFIYKREPFGKSSKNQTVMPIVLSSLATNDYDFCLDAIDPKGAVIPNDETVGLMRFEKTAPNGMTQVYKGFHNPGPIDHFVIKSRQYAWSEFSGFALEPKPVLSNKGPNTISLIKQERSDNEKYWVWQIDSPRHYMSIYTDTHGQHSVMGNDSNPKFLSLRASINNGSCTVEIKDSSDAQFSSGGSSKSAGETNVVSVEELVPYAIEGKTRFGDEKLPIFKIRQSDGDHSVLKTYSIWMTKNAPADAKIGSSAHRAITDSKVQQEILQRLNNFQAPDWSTIMDGLSTNDGNIVNKAHARLMEAMAQGRFIEPAIKILDSSFRNRDQVAHVVNNQRKHLSPDNLKQITDILLRRNDPAVLEYLKMGIIHSSDRPEGLEQIQRLAESDKPWLWLSIIRSSNAYERLKKSGTMPRNIEMAASLFGVDGQTPAAKTLTPEEEAWLINLLTPQLLQLDFSDFSLVFRAIANCIDHARATEIYVNLLEKLIGDRITWTENSNWRAVDRTTKYMNLWYGKNIGGLGSDISKETPDILGHDWQAIAREVIIQFKKAKVEAAYQLYMRNKNLVENKTISQGEYIKSEDSYREALMGMLQFSLEELYPGISTANSVETSGVVVSITNATVLREYDNWKHPALQINVFAVNRGKLPLYLPQNGQCWQLEVDGQCYGWANPMIYGAKTLLNKIRKNPISAGGTVLLDFMPGESYSDLNVVIADNWRAIAPGREKDLAGFKAVVVTAVFS